MTQLQGFQLETVSSLQKTLDEINYLSLIGCTMVRYPMYLSFIPDLNEWINRLKQILPWSLARGVRVAVCLHHPNRTVFDNPRILDIPQFYNDWEKIALELKDLKFMAIPVNEPRRIQGDGVTNIRTVYKEVAKRIRAIDPGRRICFAIPSTHIREITFWKPIEGVKDQWTEVHFYDYETPPNPYPAEYPTATRNKTTMKNRFQFILDWKAKYNMPVYVGETAIKCDLPGAAQYLKDYMEVCRELKLPYTIHAFNESPTFNYQANPALWAAIETEMGKP